MIRATKVFWCYVCKRIIAEPKCPICQKPTHPTRFEI